MMKSLSEDNEKAAKRNNIRTIRQIAAACCDYRFEAEREWDVWIMLLQHVELVHPDFYRGVDWEARRMARGNNGAGYWDSDQDNGWEKAHAEFKQSYRIKALQLSVQGHCFP